MKEFHQWVADMANSITIPVVELSISIDELREIEKERDEFFSKIND